MTAAEMIIKEVTEKHRLAVDITLKSHKKEIVCAREDAACRMRRLGFKYAEIGKILNTNERTVRIWTDHLRAGPMMRNEKAVEVLARSHTQIEAGERLRALRAAQQAGA